MTQWTHRRLQEATGAIGGHWVAVGLGVTCVCANVGPHWTPLVPIGPHWSPLVRQHLGSTSAALLQHLVIHRQ